MGIVFLAIIIFFAFVFLSLYFVFKKLNPKQSPTANIKFWLSTILLTPLVAIASLYAYLYLSSRYEDKAFETTNWIQDEDKRYLYINDLVSKEILLNKTREEVIEKLGEPEVHDKDVFHYTLGYDPKQYFNMTPDWLIVEFDNQIVVSYYIER